MPPEPQPWDRTFSGRKHARSPSADAVAAGGGGGAAAASHRWREPPPVPRDSPRPIPRPSPRLPPPGQYRQGNGYYQGYPEETGAGRVGTPSRSGDARYPGGRSGKDGRGSFRRSPWRQSPLLPPSVTAPRSLAVPVGTVTVMPSQPLVKDPDDSSGTGRDRDNSGGWKPDSHQWTRPCSLSASKSSKSELDEVASEAPVTARMDTPIRSPVVSDDGGPRKKPRLSWGQGLAKHEKKKVDGGPDTAGQSGMVQCDTAGQSGGAAQCDSSIMVAPDVTSPKPEGLPGCTSPATLGSAFSSVSSVMGQTLCIKESNNNPSHPSDASGQGLQSCSHEFSIKLDPFDTSCISNLSALITDLVQPEDACSDDSSFMRHTAMNKLFVLKEDISKELEKTECEIDLFENELKALNGDGKTHTSSVQATYSVEPCSESADVALKIPPDSNPSKLGVLVSTVALAGESLLLTHSLENGGNIKDTSVFCLATVSPKCVKPTSSVNDLHTPKLAGCPLDDDGVLTAPDGSRDDNCFDAGSSNVYADNDTSAKVKDDHSLIDIIIASNRDAARKASQVFDKSLSLDHPQYNVWDSDYLLSCRKNVKRVRKELAVHTRQCNFKEKVLALKFRAFHHLWKEDRRMLSLKKNKPKAQRHLESCSQTSGNGLQMQRTSIRSRFMLPAGNLTQVPTDEIVDFTRKLLLDSQIKIFRENLKMPALISDEMGKKYSRFISSNGLVEEPSVFEKERAMINPWTPEEKEVFLEMLGTLGKNFTKISSFLTHKTTADCVEFYYKNHKSECFIYVKKQLDLKKQPQFLRPNSGLVISQNKWNREANAASHDILGESALVAVRKNGKIRNRRKYTVRSVSGSYNDSKFIRGNSQSLDRESPVDIREKEIVAADVLAGICGALSSEAMNSSVTSSLNPAEMLKNMTTDMALTPEVPKNINEDTCSDDDCGELKSVDWSDAEKSLLIRALTMYGKDFPRISRFVGTRSTEQCKIFFSKARKCLGLDMIHPVPDMGDTLMSDMNGERSDTDNACALELDSAICSTQSCSKLDIDFTQSVENTSSERFVPNRSIPVHSDIARSCEQCEVEGTNCEEVECKVDWHTPVPNDIKLSKEGENPQSDIFLEKNDDRASRRNGSMHMATELGDGLTEEAGPYIGSVPVNPTITESTEAACLKSSEQSTVVSRLQINADNTGVSLRFIPYSNTSGDVSSTGTKVTVSSGLEFAPNYQIPVEVLSYLQKKPQIQVLDNGLPNSSSVYYEDNRHVSGQSSFNFEGQGNKRHHNLVAKDFYHPYLMGNMLNQVRQPVHILRGYPLHMFNHKEVKKIINHVSGMPVMLENISDVNEISQANQFVCPDTNSEKSSGSQLLKSQSGILNHLKSENQLEAQLPPSAESRCGELEVQSNRNGDFKLFGQIVNHPSFQQNSNPSPQECGSQSPSPKQNASVTMKRSTSQNDRTTTSRLVGSSHLDQVELPAKSYDFWDGNQIRTGYFSVPESALMLANCPESLSASSFCPTNDCVPSSNGDMTDYQQACVQTFAADAKRLKCLPELQKRNIFETMPSFHQQGRAMLGVNMVEGGEILVGAGEGVSNPVAAHKMNAGRGKLRKRKAESQLGDVEGKQ